MPLFGSDPQLGGDPNWPHLLLLSRRRAQRMQSWMLDITALDGTRLYGAGKQMNGAWWKVGSELHTAAGVFAGKTRPVPLNRSSWTRWRVPCRRWRAC